MPDPMESLAAQQARCVSCNSILLSACDNSSPGQSVFLLKPICEFTRLIHCDAGADLLLAALLPPQLSLSLSASSNIPGIAVWQKQFTSIRSAFH